MPRRIWTAREQYELGEPWREAASSPWADANGLYMGPMKTKHKPYRDAYSEDENGNCVSCGVHFSQPHKGPHEAAKKVTAADSRHPDLLASLATCGCVHTTGGRVLTGHRTAAADFTGPQDTTFGGFDDPKGWTYHKSFEPSQIARQGASAYSSMAGLPDPHSGQTDYLSARRTPESVRAVAQNYDSLPMHDPNAVKHFDALQNDVLAQHDFMTNRLGIKTQITDHDPYNDVHEMLHDVNHNKRLQVLGTHITGGHPYMDDKTNDKFRAVHDFFGHAATGRSFDRHGEQAAYLAHAQMFSPHARPALATETRGQNSGLIYHGGFQPQKTALLHPQFYSGSGAMHLSHWYRHAVPKHPDAQWGADVKRHIDQQGGWGLTMKEHPGDAPTSGFMVSHPGEREVSRSRLDPHSIRDYVSDRADLINSDPDNYYGGWEADRTPESGKGGQPGWYHDVSKNVQDPRDTAELALKNNQQAVYDLDHDEEVSTPDMVNRATSPGIGLMSRRNKWLRDG